ncbi:alpha/beta fold hydrolase [Saccharothrix variisporea]|uniref:Pimeloyl-ACP methyl ester carboxylesterase n=1 Tax=Saccharothrix variisporea TaxID=543527 RepID=A0A495XJ32_9PSEU|nr:alpha/beta hydrolase [Saccharothrix variisporea]RKT73992.1 pimeloyl-ACP methyl ester carboxylesterase [Saccharothrix variisporea]
MTSALVLAHGAGGSVRANFSPLIPVLSRTRKVFWVDYPGSGSTPRAGGPLSLDDLADRVVASAGDTPTFAVLGYSLGCAVAVRAAVRHPERVTGLVLTSGFVRADDETRARTARWRQLLAAGDRKELARYQLSLVVGEPFERAMPAEQREGMLELIALTVPPGTDDQIDLVERVDVSGDVGRVAVPTLVIGTKHDRLISPASTRALADAIPGARWAELDSGHAPSLEAPTEWIRLIEEFLG